MGNLEAVKLLLEQPSLEVNLGDNTGHTALHHATLDANIAAVKLILADPRVDLNSKDLKSQMTPFISAATARLPIDIFKLLLAEQRVDVNWATLGPAGRDATALHATICTKNIEALRLLLDDERVDVNCKDSCQMTPLIMAVNSCGMSGLHEVASQEKNIKLLELLLAHPRVDVNCKQHRSSETYSS